MPSELIHVASNSKISFFFVTEYYSITHTHTHTHTHRRLCTQLCLTLYHPMDCSLPGSLVYGIFQARILHWVPISFSNTDKYILIYMCIYIYTYIYTHTMQTWVRSLGWEDPLEKRMATHSSILAWKIPWAEEPSGLQSMGSQRAGHG